MTFTNNISSLKHTAQLPSPYVLLMISATIFNCFQKLKVLKNIFTYNSHMHKTGDSIIHMEDLGSPHVKQLR